MLNFAYLKKKILNDVRKKGWTGLRQLKLYLRSVINNGLFGKNYLIEKGAKSKLLFNDVFVR